MDHLPSPEQITPSEIATRITTTFAPDALFSRISRSGSHPPITFDREGAIQYSEQHYSSEDVEDVIAVLSVMNRDAEKFQLGAQQNVEVSTMLEASLVLGQQKLGKSVVARTVEVNET
jgi:hypothetical protein